MEKQLEALKQFRNKIGDILKLDEDNYYYQDPYLKKWLIARNWDVNKAEKMFRESYAFKRKHGVENILSDYTPSENIEKYITGGRAGRDKEGRMVRVDLYGKLDIKGMVYAFRREELEKYKLYILEKMLQDNRDSSRELGRRVDGCSAILDLQGMDRSVFWRPGLSLYLHLVKLMEDNYPDYLNKLFVINCPRIFPIIYKIAKPLISEDTRRKIFVLGKDHMKTIKEYINEDQIPAFLGGTMTDPDGNPDCLTMVSHGGTVPESLYLRDQLQTDNLTQSFVNAGSKLCLNHVVQEPGSVLRWEFKTDGYDLGFGVLFEKKPGKLVDVVKVSRVNSHIVPEDGSVECTNPGKYIVVFDNSFSWARGKKIFYHIEVQAADNSLQQEVAQMTVESPL